MPSRSHRSVAGAVAPPLAVFLVLLALVAIGAGVAWFILGPPPVHDARSELVKPTDGTPPDATESPAPAHVTRDASPIVNADDWNQGLDRIARQPIASNGKRVEEFAETAPLRGKVIDEKTGDPIYYFWVYVIPKDRGDPNEAKNAVQPSRFRNGEFELEHQPKGTYNLLVESREHETVTREIAIPYDGELKITMKHGTCIRGIVRDPLQTPLKDIEVNLVPGELDGGATPPMQRLVKTDDSGVYSFWKLPPGRYALNVSIYGDALASEPEFRLDAGGEVVHDFMLERLGTLKVVVTNVASQPIVRSRVILSQERDGRDRPMRTAYSDLQGVARVEFLREGTYKLQVKMPGFEPHEEQVMVRAGDGSRDFPVQLEVAHNGGH